MGEVEDYSDKIAELQVLYNTLNGSTGDAIAEITSPVSGYFTTSIDGYEQKYDYKTVTQTDLEQAENGLNEKQDEVADNVIGKVISDLNWYIVSPISAQESLAINKTWIPHKLKSICLMPQLRVCLSLSLQ